MNDKRHIPFPILVAVKQGDALAIAHIINYFEGFIVSRAEVSVYRPDGSVTRMVDPDIRHSMEMALIEMILDFEFR
ncbi:helix-turn-helix domain-containing protein [Listeria kieliensis]|uniref:Helix-turn-helix conjugative transposon-like domain-containing protein n=1 Tax=Listeria kieliensis TaxID=1621700 RepID=A0A3D8TQ08_9LIST|nr:helix-turn-helix domain-containing protein [Listeria kieliensis]RDX00875.1 hypothetical protein UR08_07870 [Listeria kieliensis]